MRLNTNHWHIFPQKKAILCDAISQTPLYLQASGTFCIHILNSGLDDRMIEMCYQHGKWAHQGSIWTNSPQFICKKTKQTTKKPLHFLPVFIPLQVQSLPPFYLWCVFVSSLSHTPSLFVILLSVEAEPHPSSTDVMPSTAPHTARRTATPLQWARHEWYSGENTPIITPSGISQGRGGRDQWSIVPYEGGSYHVALSPNTEHRRAIIETTDVNRLNDWAI